MTKPLHVRLEVLVDEKKPERCGPCKRRINGYCELLGIGPLSKDASGLWHLRAAACLSATEADEARERVVEAAKLLPADGVGLHNAAREVFKAVSELRSLEEKNGR